MGLVLFVIPTQAKAEEAKTVVTLQPDRKTAIYKLGEKAKFTVTVKKDGKLLNTGLVDMTFFAGTKKLRNRKKIALSKTNPFTVYGTLNKPGFLKCSATLKNRISGKCVVGFEPTKIKPTTPLPADFDAFWTAGRKELSKIPPDVKLTKMPAYCNNMQNSYKISFANVDGTRIYGFLSVPKNRKGPFPAIFSVPGAGPGNNTPVLKNWAAKGTLALFMNVHQADPTASDYYKHYDVMNRGVPYWYKGWPSREQLYFRRAYLGIDRALNYLVSRPDFDKKHLVVFGISQGGGSALIMAGLNPDKVTAVAASVPAFCDHMGYLANRKPGWPQFSRLKNYRAGYNKEANGILPYFDAANFARKITCPTIVAVGFVDNHCPPSSVYAAFNLIEAPKRMFNGPTMGHGQSKRYSDFLDKWIEGQLGLAEAIPPK